MKSFKQFIEEKFDNNSRAGNRGGAPIGSVIRGTAADRMAAHDKKPEHIRKAEKGAPLKVSLHPSLTAKGAQDTLDKLRRDSAIKTYGKDYPSDIKPVRESFNILEGRGHDAVHAFAAKQHEHWRKSFDPEGTGKERVKKNSDGSEGNINVPFNKLHPDWQKENLSAGKAALMAVRKHPKDEEKASEHVHNEWMKRNPKADYNADQHVPYSKLPEHEKEKDREHVRTIKKLIGR
jgi:hypothetical protein